MYLSLANGFPLLSSPDFTFRILCDRIRLQMSRRWPFCQYENGKRVGIIHFQEVRVAADVGKWKLN